MDCIIQTLSVRITISLSAALVPARRSVATEVQAWTNPATIVNIKWNEQINKIQLKICIRLSKNW